MINFHPSNATITSFVEGTLPSAKSLLVSAHCDMCTQCMNKTRAISESLASEIFPDEDSHSPILREFVTMFESITKDSTAVDAPYIADQQKVVEVEGRTFILPATLSRFADRVGEWSHLVGKLWQAPVDIGEAPWPSLYIWRRAAVFPSTHTKAMN